MTTPRALWIGTYPNNGAGTPAGLGEGIWRVDLDPVTGVLSGAVLAGLSPAPSFVVTHPGGRVVYAVGEQAHGSVTAFAAGPRGELAALAIVDSGGADPCHLLLSADARTLYVANYSSGSVAVLPLDADGAFARATIADGPLQVLEHTGSGLDVDRQEGPHAHFAAYAPGGEHLLVVDLGTDELRRYRIEADGRLEPDGIAATLPPGTGPRHLVVGGDPDGRGVLLYLVGELDVTVRVLRWDRATATASIVQTVPATVTPRRSGDSILPAHVVLDGARLLVSVRGADVLTVFDVEPATGLLTRAAEVDSGGAWPRHFAPLATWTVIANQTSGHLAALPAPPLAEVVPPVRGRALDRSTSTRGHYLAIPAPACVVAAV